MVITIVGFLRVFAILDCREALDLCVSKVDRDNSLYELILMDCQMPVMVSTGGALCAIPFSSRCPDKMVKCSLSLSVWFPFSRMGTSLLSPFMRLPGIAASLLVCLYPSFGQKGSIAVLC